MHGSNLKQNLILFQIEFLLLFTFQTNAFSTRDHNNQFNS